MSFIDIPEKETKPGEDTLAIGGITLPASLINSTLNDLDYLKPGQFEFHDNGADVLFVAHLDTVQDGVPKITKVNEKTREIYHPCLDNRLGLLAIRALIPHFIKGPYDVLLTTGEESGKSTAREFARDHKDLLGRYKVAVSFDRGFETPALYSSLRDKNWRDAITAIGFKPDSGSFSDTTILAEGGMRIINLPCGMRDYHGKKAYAKLAELEHSLGKLQVIVDTARSLAPCERDAEPTFYGGYQGGGYSTFPRASASLVGRGFQYRGLVNRTVESVAEIHELLRTSSDVDKELMDGAERYLYKALLALETVKKLTFDKSMAAYEERCSSCKGISTRASLTDGKCWTCQKAEREASGKKKTKKKDKPKDYNCDLCFQPLKDGEGWALRDGKQICLQCFNTQVYSGV